ncbi:hypothetical protein GGI11_006951, partial [Coemansia sp. RSA 2049]
TRTQNTDDALTMASGNVRRRRASHTPLPHEQQVPQSSHSSSASILVDSEGSSAASSSPNPASGNPIDSSKTGDSGTARTISSLEIAGLFSEYMRQFKEARAHLRLDASEFGNVTELMKSQVDEFKGEQVVAITITKYIY